MKNLLKNFLIPVIGIYFGGALIGLNAMGNCYFEQPFNYPLYTIGLFLFCFSTFILLEYKHKEAFA